MSLLIHNAMLLTPDETRAWIERGFVFIKDNLIERVGEGVPPPVCLEDTKEIIDAQGNLVIPGLINAHNHAAMSLFRGLADDLPLDKWLHDYIFPAETAIVDEEFVYWGTMLAGWEMLCSGTTCFADGYFCEDGAVWACKKLGIRAILAQGIIDFPAPGISDPKKNIIHAETFLKKWQGCSPLILPAIFAHAPYTCSESTLKRAKILANDYQTLLFIHVAETKWEFERVKKEHGLTPVAYLNKLGILDHNTIVIHANWLTDEDITILRDTGSPVVHNPESNLKLASGICPVTKLFKAGIPVALGTDGPASNNNLDMFQEMGTAAKIHKGICLDPTVMSAMDVLRMATSIGGRVLGLKTGRLEKGYLADLVIVNLKSPHLVPIYDPYSHVVYSAKGGDVETVIVNGQIIVQGGKLLTVDTQEIKKEILRLAHKIKGRLQS